MESEIHAKPQSSNISSYVNRGIGSPNVDENEHPYSKEEELRVIVEKKVEDNFSKLSVNLFLDANSLETVPASWTQNQTFRIVIVPANFSTAVNKNNIDAVMSALKVDDTDILKIKL